MAIMMNQDWIGLVNPCFSMTSLFQGTLNCYSRGRSLPFRKRSLASPTVDAIPARIVEDGIDRLSIIKRFIVYQGIDCWGGKDRLSIIKRFIVYQGIDCWNSNDPLQTENCCPNLLRSWDPLYLTGLLCPLCLLPCSTVTCNIYSYTKVRGLDNF